MALDCSILTSECEVARRRTTGGQGGRRFAHNDASPADQRSGAGLRRGFAVRRMGTYISLVNEVSNTGAFDRSSGGAGRNHAVHVSNALRSRLLVEA